MGGLVNTLEEVLYVNRTDNTKVIDRETVARLKQAEVIELHYTLRLKDKNELVIELRCNGMTEAITRRSSEDGAEVVRNLLQKEAREVDNYLKKRISSFDAQFKGYYFLGNLRKQKSLGVLL